MNVYSLGLAELFSFDKFDDETAAGAVEQLKTVAEDIYGSSTFDYLSSWIKMGDEGTKYSQMWTLAKSVYDSLSVIGVGLLLLMISIKLLGEITRSGQPPTIEFIAKAAFQLIAGYILVTKGYDILMGLIAGVDEIFDTVTNAMTNNVDESADDAAASLLANAITNGKCTDINSFATFLVENGWRQISLWGSLVKYNGAVIAMKIADLAIIACLIGRGLTIIGYTMLAPLAIADVASGPEFTATPAMRFFKKYAAALLQGILIIIIIYAGRLLSASVQSTTESGVGSIGDVFLSNLVGFGAVKFATVTLCQRSSQLAQDIIS